jgi:hypothetical protein
MVSMQWLEPFDKGSGWWCPIVVGLLSAFVEIRQIFGF